MRKKHLELFCKTQSAIKDGSRIMVAIVTVSNKTMNA